MYSGIRISFLRSRACGSVRTLTQSAIHCNAANTTAKTDASATTVSTEQVTTNITSSVAAGIALKGINYMKDGNDPISKEDKEYPDWLWTLLTPKPPINEMEKGSKERLRRVNRKSIRDANFMKSQ